LFLTDEVQLLDGALILNGGTRFTVDNQFGNAFTSGVG
jgi:outer membrane receptor for ferrienterochelin and colicin